MIYHYNFFCIHRSVHVTLVLFVLIEVHRVFTGLLGWSYLVAIIISLVTRIRRCGSGYVICGYVIGLAYCIYTCVPVTVNYSLMKAVVGCRNV